MKYRIRPSRELYESLRTARGKYGDLVPSDVFDIFIKADGHRNFKYIEKMCEYYLEGHKAEDILSMINNWSKRLSWIEEKDITNKGWVDLLKDINNADRVREASKSQIIKNKKKNSIYKSDKTIIYNIDDFADIAFYGKGTKWCIAYNRDAYNLWANEFIIYVIVNKMLPTNDKDYKMVVLINPTTGVKMFVNSENIHYFTDTKDYWRVRDEIIDEFVVKELGL